MTPVRGELDPAAAAPQALRWMYVVRENLVVQIWPTRAKTDTKRSG